MFIGLRINVEYKPRAQKWEQGYVKAKRIRRPPYGINVVMPNLVQDNKTLVHKSSHFQTCMLMKNLNCLIDGKIFLGIYETICSQIIHAHRPSFVIRKEQHLGFFFQDKWKPGGLISLGTFCSYSFASWQKEGQKSQLKVLKFLWETRFASQKWPRDLNNNSFLLSHIPREHHYNVPNMKRSN